MNNTPVQHSAATRDPICGMPVEPGQAFATRTIGEETFSFCSERCVGQFDRDHAGSATTGASDTSNLCLIDLPVADFDGRHGADYLEEQLLDVPGVRQALANPKSKLVRVVYDPGHTTVEKLVERAKDAGG